MSQHQDCQECEANHVCALGSLCREHKCLGTRIVLWVIALFIMFSAGYGIGKVKGMVKYAARDNSPFWDLRGSYGEDQDFDGKGLGFWEGERGTRMFGTIENIQGNQITIIDNGGAEKIVFSGTNTIIRFGNDEIGLTALHAGQGITAYGMKTKDGELGARLIRVSAAQ